MLAVQTYLAQHGLETLQSELAIEVNYHPTLPLMVLNYHQTKSLPKTHPVVRECRGLILHQDTYALVARSFYRFFNWGEVQEEAKLFDFSDFDAITKEDGSLITFFHFQGRWHCATRGSFADGLMRPHDFTWTQLVCRTLGISSLKELDGRLDPRINYICELCSPFNKVVRRYPEPQLFLLSAFEGENEIPFVGLHGQKGVELFDLPDVHPFTSAEEILAFLDRRGKEDATFEGVVICDRDFRRFKFKSEEYRALHALRGNGDSLFHPRRLLPFILAKNPTAVLGPFPEVTDEYTKLDRAVEGAWQELLAVFHSCQGIESQKDFALHIVPRTPFASLLFLLRKEHGAVIPPSALEAAWRGSAELIGKRLFGC